MKNWIIVLLIFVIPLGLYAFLDAKAQNDMMCTTQQEKLSQQETPKLIKFSSPMCSECQEVAQELSKVPNDAKSSVAIEEINVLENTKPASDYNKKMIKKYKVTLVPTLVFVDKEGKTVYRKEGAMKAEEITKVLASMK